MKLPDPKVSSILEAEGLPPEQAERLLLCKSLFGAEASASYKQTCITKIRISSRGNDPEVGE
jgi:hypothetical protein